MSVSRTVAIAHLLRHAAPDQPIRRPFAPPSVDRPMRGPTPPPAPPGTPPTLRGPRPPAPPGTRPTLRGPTPSPGFAAYSPDVAGGSQTMTPRTTCSGSRPLDRSPLISWYASTKRIVPDAVRSTIECVNA